MATTPDLEFERGLPASLDAERTILGAVLLDNHAYNDASALIRPEDFALTAHQRVFARMGELIDTGHVVDIVTLSEELARRKEIESVGGVAWLASLTEGLPRRLSIDEYVRIVKDKSLLRQLINICSTAITRAADQSEGAIDVLNDAESALLEVTEKGISRGFASVHEIVAGSFKTIDNLYKEGREVTGLATHFDELDRMTSGLQNSELVIIAARPSMGKTAFAMNVAEHVAVNQKKPVAVFSLEMSSQQLVQRMLCSRARVNLQRVRDGFLGERDFPSLTAAASKLAEARMFIDDSASLSILELRAKARRLKAQQDVSLIIVDYLQLLRSTTRRAQDNRQLEISEISAGLKALAKDLKIPVIVVAQLNRQPEQRTGGKPRLSDLRESGSIEQDADLVGLLVRPELYEEDEEARVEKAGEAELIIAKQRNGPVGEIPLTFLKEYTRFETRARNVSEPEEAF